MFRFPSPHHLRGVSASRLTPSPLQGHELSHFRRYSAVEAPLLLPDTPPATLKAAQKSTLRKVPGIGPKNEALLQLQQVTDVQQLQNFFLEKCDSNKEKMLRWLRNEAGIKNKRHCASIIGFLAADSDASTSVEGSGRLTLAVEGNISAGKSTFLRMLEEETARLEHLVEVVPEPVDKWQKVGDRDLNLLDLFYQDPDRFAYTFQNYVLITRVCQLQERDSRNGAKPLRLLERSVFSDRMVFVRAVHDATWLSDEELDIYDSWFNPVVKYFPGLVPDGFIYLRAQPETCHRRMTLRNRNEETGVELDYLADLHQKHEEWLLAGVSPSEINSGFLHNGNGVPPLMVPSLNIGIGAASNGHRRPNNNFPSPPTPPKNLVVPEPASIKGQVRFLQGSGVHPNLLNTPALILDCDQDIDVINDTAAKLHFAEQVRAYYNYVKELRQASEQAAKSTSNGTNCFNMHNARELQLL